MTILVTSLFPTSQTLDGVALGAYASQYRSGSTASMGAELTAAIGAHKAQAVDVKLSQEVLSAATTLTKYDTGRTFYLDSATEFAVTLPAPELGLQLSFVVKTAPAGADYTVVSSGGANIIKGSVTGADLNAATDGDIETAGGDTVSFVSAKAVSGDRVDMTCDGSSWYVRGHCSVFDAITISTAA